MQDAAITIMERADKGMYKGVCPRCGVNLLGKEAVFRTRSRQIPKVCICQECNVDELIGPNGGVLPPEQWAIISSPDAAQEGLQ